MARIEFRQRPGPGGVDDGLPQDALGAPLLPRWFAIAMVVLVPAGLIVVAWAFLSIGRPSIDPAARRPPGSATVTHERGDAALNEIRSAEPGPGCAAGITLVGDASARAIARRALEEVCRLLPREGFAAARRGLERWVKAGGVLRVAVFELTGLDSSARTEGGAVVVELNAKFQFEEGARAAPAIVHELTHLAGDWPGQPLTAEAELEAVRTQLAACERLSPTRDPPRGCRDARELLAEPDPLARLRAAGFP